MKKWRLGILIVFVSFCFALVGCGGGGGNSGEAPQEQTQDQDSKFGGGETAPEPEPEPEPEPVDYSAIFQGDWVLVSMESPDNQVTDEDLQSMRDAGLTVDLTLAEDGTAKMVMFGEDYGSGTWSAVTSTVCDLTMEGQKIDVTYDPTTERLSLSQGDEYMFFVRNDSASGGSAPAPAADYNLVDSLGNPTLYGVLELNGNDLVNAIEISGYTWDSEDKWYVSDDGNDCFYVSSNNDYEYLENEIKGLDVNGKGSSCVYVIVVDDVDYSSAEDAFNKLCNIDVTNIRWLDETKEIGIAIVKGPSGTENFVIIDHNTDIGLYVIDVFNEKGISSGLTEEYVGDGMGTSLDELRSNLF